jgi:hypothetical protein
MKKIFSIFAFIAVSTAINAQTAVSSATNPNAPEFQWVSDVYDFGKIPQGIPTEARFEFVNSGKEALIITDVQKTCGCTKTDWSKEPIAPGQKGWIIAEYNAAAEGAFTKAITVMSNSKTPSLKLTFKGTVVKDESGSVPQQQSIFGN